MKTAVIILNWNGVALLRKFLPSVVEYSGTADIYVADNASTDESLAFIETEFRSVKIIRNASNLGFANGYNESLKNLDADIYVLLNSDVEVTPNWLSPIISTFESEAQTAIIQPKILDFKRKDYFEYAGAGGGFIDKYGYPFCRGRIFETLEKDTGQYDQHAEIFWASGACFAIRKSVFDELKGFDADFFAHQEEIDLCWRAHNSGYRAKFIHESVVYHVGGATLDNGSPSKTYLNFRNSLLMLVKNLPQETLYKTLFVRMLLDGIAAFRFLTQGKWKHFVAVIRAHGAFYGMFGRNFKKRKATQTSDYYKIKSIVYAYFVRNQKTFKRLF